jgi:hypothetical protein
MAKKPDMYAMIKARAAEAAPAGRKESVPVPDARGAIPAAALTLEPPVTAPASMLSRASGATRSRGSVIASEIERPKGFNVRPPRIEKPHQSVYAHPKVFAALRQIAANEEIKPQDLYREGLRHVLARRGYDFDKLDAGEA